ncbi:bifunctional 3-phenylpropionate/cinnamic acid dioxygenase ferredoxin subunit [Streptosporangium sp. KLBMP 9127]|nr:bifunctional 3-phenylpropionate/cinnamic acid dioxygenase ferredoxin subunit [Streptosporangium sp. KLBMP 9127]
MEIAALAPLGFTEVCRLDELRPGESHRMEGEVPIALFNVEGEIFAIDDTCTHQDASLADGWLEGRTIECPLHSSCFDLRTGIPTGLPARRPVRVHQVIIENGVIYVRA